MGWFVCYNYPSEFLIHDTSSQLEVVFEKETSFSFMTLLKKEIITFESVGMLRKYLLGK